MRSLTLRWTPRVWYRRRSVQIASQRWIFSPRALERSASRVSAIGWRAVTCTPKREARRESTRNSRCVGMRALRVAHADRRPPDVQDFRGDRPTPLARVPRPMAASETVMTTEEPCAARAQRRLPCRSRPARPSDVARKAWYEGGTLGQARAREWRSATPHNRLATASDLVTTYLDSEHDGAGTDMVQSAIVATGELGLLSGVHTNLTRWCAVWIQPSWSLIRWMV